MDGAQPRGAKFFPSAAARDFDHGRVAERGVACSRHCSDDGEFVTEAKANNVTKTMFKKTRRRSTS